MVEQIVNGSSADGEFYTVPAYRCRKQKKYRDETGRSIEKLVSTP